jgi:hypothetical protein
MTYPQHIQQLRDDLGLSCLMAFGPGWATLVRQAVMAMRALDPSLEIEGVESKYGALRISLAGPLRLEIEDLGSQAEEQSQRICEACGAPGRLREDRPWVATLCDRCTTR